MESKTYPKILVVSHNVFSTTSSMGKTMSAFFNGWDSEKLAQFYLHSEVPNTDICKKYFRTTDIEMIEAIIKLRKPGNELNENTIDLSRISNRVDSGRVADIYQIGRKRKPYMYLVRNLLWGTNKWKTKELIKWINEFNPDVVFYASGDYSFSMKIALQICRYKRIPLVVYFGDDYYYDNSHKGSIINWINRKIYKATFKDMFSYLSRFITASDKMQRKYSEEFIKTGYGIMTSTDITDIETSFTNSKISYIGNLGLDRWKPLVEIGRHLKEMGLVLDVYSGDENQSVISQLTHENGINFHGPVSSTKVKEVITSSTIIIHVESMSEVNKARTRYSMSTKIAESLGSGVCLFAYGPDDISSLEYLIENAAACVVTKKKDLHMTLKEILQSKELRSKYINNALKLASERNNYETNTQLFYKIIKNTCEDWKSDLKNENLTD